MTMTDVRPDAGAPTPQTRVEPAESWFTTGDHKKLGLLYLGAALLFLIVGGVLAMLLRVHLAEPSSDLLGGKYGRVFSAHAAVMTLLFLVPAWIGLATYLLPLQVGAGRVAFPRVHAAAFWGYLFGGVLLIASLLAGPTGGLGYTNSTPPVFSGPANRPTVLWAASLIVLALATIAANISLFVTALGLRTEGMTFSRMPAFSFSVMLTAGVTILATPVFVGGLVLLLIDAK
jgi:cytochrome c oxidase subunit 1